jgi:hypothetical protein
MDRQFVTTRDFFEEVDVPKDERRFGDDAQAETASVREYLQK